MLCRLIMLRIITGKMPTEENPFPAICDAAYCKHAGELSHGHRQHAQKLRSRMWFQIYSYSALSMGKKTPSRRYAIRPIINMLQEDRATDRGNVQKIGKYRMCGSGDILVDRQTYRQTYSPIYFATAPTGEVKIFVGRVMGGVLTSRTPS